MIQNKTDLELAIDLDFSDMFREMVKTQRNPLYFRRDFVHIYLLNDLPRYPAAQEYVDILSFLLETDKRLLSEPENENEESLLSVLEILKYYQSDLFLTVSR